MGVASIPDHKDQRSCDEWNALIPIRKMDVGKGATEEFVTVVSVGSQPTSENFVTVLSIGSGKKEDDPPAGSLIKSQANGLDGHLEEEVEVFRLPGERLGFGLKFEGGSKTSERVRRLFVQSCAEQSPASRAKCSWGALGEGDEVLSIDGVPVTHMTRLDCVRRLKESQLVIRLMVRCRGALRPEVVSAERKTSPEKSKVPPELPSAPPPVPPRKLRQPRGSADGEANPSPVKKTWDGSRSQNGSQNGSQSGSQSSSQNSSQNGSPGNQADSKSTSFESCESSPRSVNGSARDSPKGSPKERSPEFSKSKQIEPPEAMVYLDARSQCGSTHGSTSDDTGSSMSTVVDRFSTSDRVSTISTASTASTASEQPGELSRAEHDSDRSSDRDGNSTTGICPFETLDGEYSASTPPDYLLRRLASSEAVTHVESRGEVERITAVVAPNTVLIEETITFQPPLSFQDAPLSYGHEARPDLFYAADLAADSTTHFRPIKDDAEIVERVNGEEFRAIESSDRCKEGNTDGRTCEDKTPPPLPARNHVNRISVNQPSTNGSPELNARSRKTVDSSTPDNPDVPLLPPKPLPRKDVKVRRKRPPPPPPPPAIVPRREVKPATFDERKEGGLENDRIDPPREETEIGSKRLEDSPGGRSKSVEEKAREGPSESSFKSVEEIDPKNLQSRESESIDEEEHDDGEIYKTNKVLEIIEIRKARALSPQKAATICCNDEINRGSKFAGNNERVNEPDKERIKPDVEIIASNNERSRSEPIKNGITSKSDESEEESEKVMDDFNDSEARTRIEVACVFQRTKGTGRNGNLDCARDIGTSAIGETAFGRQESEDDETYRSLDEINEDLSNSGINDRSMDDEAMMDDDDTTDESDEGDYYWQSNLATIGEEEETNSLEYTNANKAASDTETSSMEKQEPRESPTIKKEHFDANARNDEVDAGIRIADFSEPETKKLNAETVNGRMDNCGGGQRLPPDGDEFPASYQEFASNSPQQYRFVTTARTSTISTNGGGLVCTENESFVAGDNYKILEGNVVNSRTGIILSDSRVTLTSHSVEKVCQEVTGKVGPPSIEINGKLPISGVDNVCQDSNHRDSRVEDGKGYVSEDFARKGTPASGYANYDGQGNGNILISEKKIEITGYYHKDAPGVEETQEREKEIGVPDTPPPLPLTGPPKMEAIASQARTAPALEQPQRKFSLNGELWRQDDKSERSVRDKIAMFSSQSSLDTPLFPNAIAVSTSTGTGRRLSKYKSSEDVCIDEKTPGQKDRASFFADRTQSSFDLTDSARNVNQETCRKYGQRSPSLSSQGSPFNSNLPTILASKTFPVVPQKPVGTISTPVTTSYEKPSPAKSSTKNYSSNVTQYGNSQSGAINSSVGDNCSSVSLKPIGTSALTRATSFSGTMPYGQDRSSTIDPAANSQISRTNSLASTFRRPSEDIRRTSLNQLIEQRRRSISKLRGLVIPEKEAVPIDQPIVDLPEIKSRDSILLHQIPKANIQDKWGSQSSLASNTSTASAPLKATTSFKMPAPQIHSKYSPAFKRKSLTVYGSSTTTSSSVNGGNLSKTSHSTSTPTSTGTTSLSEPPKSLESICSPTRSDYSFEFASTASSPEGSRNRPKTAQRKTRMDYDDSDNDSAVSSSQSSISRGFSPPMSPVPSERSTVSSERSYVSTETNYQRRSLIIEGPRGFPRDSAPMEYASRASILGERTYHTERSSSSSSSAGSNSRSPTTEVNNSRNNSQIPQRQTLKRSNSTDTNCSSSSTLTSGSQASAESLSRRVLKPQSVEAINRKNILASARCRSGRELNGSPLIQRKFNEDENHPAAAHENAEGARQRAIRSSGIVSSAQDVKIAYIEVTDPFAEEEEPYMQSEEPKLPPKRSVPSPIARPPKSEMLEPSNDLKMWVRAEAKALARSAEEKSVSKPEPASMREEVSGKISNLPSRNSRSSGYEEEVGSGAASANRNAEQDVEMDSPEVSKQRPKTNMIAKKTPDDNNDLLTILTTKSRSRSAIHVDDGSFGRSKSQMSLEDILSAKAEAKLTRAQSVEGKPEKNGVPAGNQNHRAAWETKENRHARRNSATSNESWSEERPFVSKIPTLGRSRLADSGDEMTDLERSKSTTSKIPTPRNLGRRSASVTDMKKALEKMDVNSTSQHQTTGNAHNRFPSLDSSVDECVSPMGTDVDADRFCGEQFGSISSLASSTSLISQQELAQLVEEASLEEARGAHDVIVVLLHKENPTGSVGITLGGGADCEVKEITVHRVLAHSIADRDGRVQRGDRILSINGRSTRGLTHRESLAVLKQPRSEVVLVVSRARLDEGCKLRSRTASVETIIEGFETNGVAENTAWGPPSVIAVYKDGAGLGFSLEGGRDSPLGDRPLVIKKIFTGGAAEKTGALKAGDQLLEVNGSDVTRMSRIEAWSLMKKLHDGEVNLLVRHPATKSS